MKPPPSWTSPWCNHGDHPFVSWIITLKYRSDCINTTDQLLSCTSGSSSTPISTVTKLKFWDCRWFVYKKCLMVVHWCAVQCSHLHARRRDNLRHHLRITSCPLAGLLRLEETDFSPWQYWSSTEYFIGGPEHTSPALQYETYSSSHSAREVKQSITLTPPVATSSVCVTAGKVQVKTVGRTLRGIKAQSKNPSFPFHF